MTGCHRTSAVPIPQPSARLRASCRLPVDSTGPSDTLTVVLSEPVDSSHLLSPINDSELMLSRLLHPTLERLDCEGRLRPGLATGWTRASESNVWVFVLGNRVVSFQMAENGDPRDAIDRGIDLAVTRDPSVVAYVRDRADLETYPLPWSRTYVMLQPSAAVPIELSGLDSLRRSLARDAIRSDARAAVLPFWADSLASCADSASPSERPNSSRVVYPRYDPAARGLAERIVALSRDPKLTAAPLDAEEFDRALRAGRDRAYIAAVPRRTLAPCREARNWAPHARLTPLVDTRAYAIVRRGSPPLTVEWDGTVVPEDSP